jgi:hypothetical protein
LIPGLPEAGIRSNLEKKPEKPPLYGVVFYYWERMERMEVKVLEKQANGNPIANPDNAELKQSPDFEDMTELLEYCLRTSPSWFYKRLWQVRDTKQYFIQNIAY